ncbi:Nucleic-acid-binding protein from transposon X-element [Lucilia cuprina]|nr:Nucleic-acid-binding protein from transposon X-element [Lucilia cuprina]
MEKDPLLSQTGGRPPNNLEKPLCNANGEACAFLNDQTNEKPSGCQSEAHITLTSKDGTNNNNINKNSQLGKEFFDAVFSCQPPLTEFNENPQESQNSNNIKILENIQIPTTVFQNETCINHEAFSVSSLEEEFQTVKNKKRKIQGDVKIDLSKCKFKSFNMTDDNINRTNKYSLLGDLNIEAERPVSSTTRKPYDSKIDNDIQTQVRTKNSFCPPIFLENVNVKSLIDQLISKNVEFKIKNQSKYKTKLYFKDSSAHTEMMQLLKEKDIPSYTYTPKEHKRQSVVCRGLYYKSEINDIKSEIDRIIPDTVDSVTEFSTEYSRKQGIDTGLFLVILKPNRKVNELLGLKYILNQVVSWERPKASTKIPQCWRCQRWGHYSQNCSRPYSCVKCNDKHGPGECTFNSEGNETPFCVNCNENGHSSNYRGCPSYRKYVSLRKKSNQEANDRKRSATENVARALNTSNAITSDKPFSSLFKNSNDIPSQDRPEKPTIIREFMELAKILCAPDPLTLEDRINNFMGNYKSMSRDQARKECLSLIKDIQNVYGP